MATFSCWMNIIITHAATLLKTHHQPDDFLHQERQEGVGSVGVASPAGKKRKSNSDSNSSSRSNWISTSAVFQFQHLHSYQHLLLILLLQLQLLLIFNENFTVVGGCQTLNFNNKSSSQVNSSREGLVFRVQNKSKFPGNFQHPQQQRPLPFLRTQFPIPSSTIGEFSLDSSRSSRTTTVRNEHAVSSNNARTTASGLKQEQEQQRSEPAYDNNNNNNHNNVGQQQQQEQQQQQPSSIIHGRTSFKSTSPSSVSATGTGLLLQFPIETAPTTTTTAAATFQSQNSTSGKPEYKPEWLVMGFRPTTTIVMPRRSSRNRNSGTRLNSSTTISKLTLPDSRRRRRRSDWRNSRDSFSFKFNNGTIVNIHGKQQQQEKMKYDRHNKVVKRSTGYFNQDKNKVNEDYEKSLRLFWVLGGIAITFFILIFVSTILCFCCPFCLLAKRQIHRRTHDQDSLDGSGVIFQSSTMGPETNYSGLRSSSIQISGPPIPSIITHGKRYSQDLSGLSSISRSPRPSTSQQGARLSVSGIRPYGFDPAVLPPTATATTSTSTAQLQVT